MFFLFVAPALLVCTVCGCSSYIPYYCLIPNSGRQVLRGRVRYEGILLQWCPLRQFSGGVSLHLNRWKCKLYKKKLVFIVLVATLSLHFYNGRMWLIPNNNHRSQASIPSCPPKFYLFLRVEVSCRWLTLWINYVFNDIWKHFYYIWYIWGVNVKLRILVASEV